MSHEVLYDSDYVTRKRNNTDSGVLYKIYNYKNVVKPKPKQISYSIHTTINSNVNERLTKRNTKLISTALVFYLFGSLCCLGATPPTTLTAKTRRPPFDHALTSMRFERGAATRMALCV